ncbi:RNA exonuclease 4 [[Candida] zeylanoides]
MATLSSNWKALKAKQASSNGSAATKVTKKRTVAKRPSVAPAKIPTLAAAKLSSSVIATKPSTSPTCHNSQSTIGSVLWNQPKDVSVFDIPDAPMSLAPIGKDARKMEPGKYVAIDCEFVGIGFEGKESALARISIVNFYGHVLLDKFVKPKEKVVDWRTWVSGVTPKHMKDAITFEEAQRETAKLLKDRILVGHAVHHDLDSLFLSHSRYMIRDTSKFAPFRQIAMGKTPSLKKLALHFLKIDIQGAEHSSVEDARATMLLFRLYRKQFEQSMRLKHAS